MRVTDAEHGGRSSDSPIATLAAACRSLVTYVAVATYVLDPLGTRRTLGFNWPSRSEGQAAHRTILELIRTEKIKPFVGRDISFADIPDALEAMERRETVGRLVAHIS